MADKIDIFSAPVSKIEVKGIDAVVDEMPEGVERRRTYLEHFIEAMRKQDIDPFARLKSDRDVYRLRLDILKPVLVEVVQDMATQIMYEPLINRIKDTRGGSLLVQSHWIRDIYQRFQELHPPVLIPAATKKPPKEA